MRHPVVSLVAAGGVLIALAVPALGLQTVVSGPDDMPRTIPVVQTYDRITEAFPGEAAGSTVVVKADDVTTGPVAAAIGDLKQSAREDRVVNGPVTERDQRRRHRRLDRSADRRQLERRAPRPRRWSGSATRSSRARSRASRAPRST